MIRVSVLYPYKDDATFDHEYYTQKHLALVKSKLSTYGLLKLEADKGISGEDTHLPPPFVCIGYLHFQSLTDFRVAMEMQGEALMSDIPNYTDLTPRIQVSEIVGP